MRLFLYYSFCSAKNQIKKMFRSWVAIFFAVCLLFGLIVGLGAALFADFIDGADESGEESGAEEILPPEEEPALTEGQVLAVTELVAAGVVLTVLFCHVFLADKNGSAIFLMPDVNLLFASPMKPQSVLLFRLMSQILVTLFASVYLCFQLPNLVLNLGLPLSVGLALILAWVFTLVYGKLLNVLIYTVTSTHIRLKKYIRPLLYTVILLLAGGFYFYYSGHSDQKLIDTLIGFFNAPATRWIPIYGWLKGLAFWVAEGEWLAAGGTLLLLVAVAGALAYVIWHIKADFYEDAMAKSQETAEMMAAAQSGKSVRRKKERSDRIVRDGLNYGSGAMMFFCKTIYNRFRFATLKVFTKTTILYLAVGVGISILLLRGMGGGFPVVGLLLCCLVFFRALGNPIGEDVGKPYFLMVPASPYAKVIWSLLGGTACCAMDLLPALAVSALTLRASLPEVLGWFLLALGLDFYVSNIMLFLELSLPTALATQIRQAILMMLFMTLGILPLIPVLLVGILTQFWLPLLLGTAGFGFAVLGGVFYAFSPLFLIRGRK